VSTPLTRSEHSIEHQTERKTEHAYVTEHVIKEARAPRRERA
jgi:hypothetical protein